MSRIRVIWYFWTGRESHAHDCDSIAEAYERLERTGMDAIAYPVGSDHGLYMWRPGDNNTLEVFQAKMEILGGI